MMFTVSTFFVIILKKNTEKYNNGKLIKTLIDEGLKILCRDGAESFSLRNLSKELGVSHAAAYRHFSSKEELLRAILAEFEESFRHALLTSVAPDATGKEALMQLGIGYVRYFVSQPELITLFTLSRDGEDLFARLLGTSPKQNTLEAPDQEDEDIPCEKVTAANDRATHSFELFRSLALAMQSEEPYKDLTDREILLGFWGKVHGIATILVTQRRLLSFDDIDATIDRTIRTAF